MKTNISSKVCINKFCSVLLLLSSCLSWWRALRDWALTLQGYTSFMYCTALHNNKWQQQMLIARSLVLTLNKFQPFTYIQTREYVDALYCTSKAVWALCVLRGGGSLGRSSSYLYLCLRIVAVSRCWWERNAKIKWGIRFRCSHESYGYLFTTTRFSRVTEKKRENFLLQFCVCDCDIMPKKRLHLFLSFI